MLYYYKIPQNVENVLGSIVGVGGDGGGGRCLTEMIVLMVRRFGWRGSVLFQNSEGYNGKLYKGLYSD